jgi:hypothetical protein
VGSRQYADGWTLIERQHIGRTDKELQDASEHVRYEIELPEATAALLRLRFSGWSAVSR